MSRSLPSRHLRRGAIVLAWAVLASLVVTASAASQSGGGYLMEAAPGGEHPIEDSVVTLDDVSAFSVDGGAGVFEPSTAREEGFSYGSVDPETGRLVGVDRSLPIEHEAGAYVEAAASSPEPSPSGSEASPSPPATPQASPSVSPTPGSESESGGSVEPATPGAGGEGELEAEVEGPQSASAAPPTACDLWDSLSDIYSQVTDKTLPSCPADEGLIEAIDETIGTACGVLPFDDGNAQTTIEVPEGAWECVLKVVGAVELIMTEVCSSTDAGQCATNLIQQIDELLGTVCENVTQSDNLEGLEVPPGVFTCISAVVGLVEVVMVTACDSIDAETCVNNLLQRIHQLLVDTCDNLTAIPDSGWTAPVQQLRHPCVEKVVDALNYALIEVCGSTDIPDCVNETIRKIDDAVGELCSDLVAPLGIFEPNGETGVETCVLKAIKVVEVVMVRVCDSAEAQSCAENLLAEVDSLVASVCGMVPTAGDAALELGFPGAEMCVSKTLDLVDQVLVIACGSSDGPTCAVNLLEAIDDALAEVCGAVPVTEVEQILGLPSGVEMCLGKAIGAIETALELLCGASDAPTCIEAAIVALGEIIAEACGSEELPDCGGALTSLVEDVVEAISCVTSPSHCVLLIPEQPDYADAILEQTPDPFDALFPEPGQYPCPEVPGGTNGNDVIKGTQGCDTIRARAGDDIVMGLAGGDLILLGDGNDEAEGGGGKDDIDGNDGDDIIFGGDRGDIIRGMGGDDILRGQQGPDLVEDCCQGGDVDLVCGGGGDDELSVKDDDILDQLMGGPGVDASGSEYDTTPYPGDIADWEAGC